MAAEGSYGSSPFYQTSISPIDPGTSTSKFVANVSRKKTRKWVEAKTINYDGSGWGDEDDEDDEDVAGPPLPLPATAPISRSSTPTAAPATRNLPSMAATATVAGASSAGSPALRARGDSPSPRPGPGSRTQSPSSWRQASPPPRSESPGTAPSPTAGVGGGAGGAAAAATTGAPRSGSLPRPWADGTRSASPLGPRAQSQSPAASASAGPAGPRRPGHFIRPSDIYKRAVTAESASLPAPTSTADRASPVAVSTPASVAPPKAFTPTPTSALPPKAFTPTPTSVAPPKAFTPTPTSAVPPKAFAPVTCTVGGTERAGSCPPATAIAPAPILVEAQHKPKPSVDSLASTDSTGDVAAEYRFSSSPKLPVIARFSTFSPELLFGEANFLSSASAPSMPSLPEPATWEETNEAPGPTGPVNEQDAFQRSQDLDSQRPKDSAMAAARDSTVTATTGTTAFSSADEAAVERGPESPAVKEASSPKSGSPKAAVLPLTTELPQQPQQQQNPGSVQVTPTEPLNPQRGNAARASLLLMAPLSSTAAAATAPDRAGSASSVTSSPVKESDKLREEIMRTLSQTKLTEEPEEMELGATETAVPEATAGTSKPAGALPMSKEPARTLTRESSYLQNVYDDYWTADDASEHSTPSGSIPPMPAAAAATAAAAVAAAAAAATTGTAAAAAATTGTAATAATATTAPATSAAVGPGSGLGSGSSSSTTTATATPTPGSTSADASAKRRSTFFPLQESHPPAVQRVQTEPFRAGPAGAGGKTLRRRFSWEADAEEPVAPAPASVPTADASSLPATTANGGTDSAKLATPLSPLRPGATEAPASATTASVAPVRSMLDIALPGATAAAVAASETKAPAETEPTSLAEERAAAEQATTAPTSPVSLASPTLPAATATRTRTVSPTTTRSAAPAAELTLRQCMAGSSHPERMARLRETRHQAASADDGGLSSWLMGLLAQPEYAGAQAQAQTAPEASLWSIFRSNVLGGGNGGSGSGGRDGDGTAASTNGAADGGSAAAAMQHLQAPPAHVPTRTVSVAPHVSVSLPSGTQISHKGKEILAATGKAGKGLLALRKKGFHRKSAA